MAPIPTEDDHMQDYLEGWSAISRAMEDGVSWSGHERDCAFLNTGRGDFVEAAAIAGFDSLEDGRVVCRTDWDRDGDEDLWVRSRSGRSLRYLENQSNPERFVSFAADTSLTGVQITLGDPSKPLAPSRKAFMPVQVTDGYLAAPSRRITLAVPDGLQVTGIKAQHDGEAEPVDLVPGAGGKLEGRLVVRDGALAEDKATPRVMPKDRLPLLAPSSLPGRTVLRTPLPLPVALLRGLGVPPRTPVEQGVTAARLVVVRAPKSNPCQAEIPIVDFLAKVELAPGASHHPANGSEDPPGDDPEGAASESALRALVQSLLGPGTQTRLPVGILLGPGAHGTDAVQVIYQGAIDPEVVREDANWFVDAPVKMSQRTTWGSPRSGSRWFHYAPRSYSKLKAALRAVGASAAASEYSAFESQGR